jgi:2',3'-cyclic-nucleotide 2'-phosphodiesterase (5'-nucleotidase family)
MSSLASRLFLLTAVLIALSVAFWVIQPNESRQYHLVLTGVSKGRTRPFKAKFKPYKGKTMGGTAGIAAVVKEAVASFSGDPYNFVSIGSEISGTADAYFTRGSAIIAALNGLGIEAMLVGNIEFSFGHERLRKLADKARFAFLSSNVTESGTGQTPDYIAPELILYPGAGLKVGLIGLTPPATPDLTFRGNVAGLDFALSEIELKNRIAALRMAGCNVVVLLTLYDRDRISSAEWNAIAESAPDVCVMLDYEIEEPPVTMRDGVIIKTLSGYNKSKEVDILDLQLSGSPLKIVSFAGRRIPVNHAVIEADKEVERLVKNATRQIRQIRKERIADFADDYQRKYQQECPIGNMVADAMLLESKAQVSIQNSGGIQSDISSGEFSMGDLFGVLPFDNQLVVLELEGSDLLELFSRSASLQRGILQVAGASYSFTNRKVDDYELTGAWVNNKKLIATQTYKVVTNSFLADGGDNFIAFRNGKNLHFGRQQRDVVIDYLKRLDRDGPIVLKTEGRVLVEE